MDTSESPSSSFYEGPSRLMNDQTGACVGISVNESMDVRVMNNAPYAVNQHNE